MLSNADIEECMARNFVWDEGLVAEQNVTVAGIGALILNGLSTRRLETNLGILTKVPGYANF